MCNVTIGIDEIHSHIALPPLSVSKPNTSNSPCAYNQSNIARTLVQIASSLRSYITALPDSATCLWCNAYCNIRTCADELSWGSGNLRCNPLHRILYSPVTIGSPAEMFCAELIRTWYQQHSLSKFSCYQPFLNLTNRVLYSSTTFSIFFFLLSFQLLREYCRD